jgi:c-di-GMP-binding flagellar brake protein YcgR
MVPEDRRRHPRYEVQGLRARLQQIHRCDVLKLSRGGMLVSTPVELQPEAVVASELYLTGTVFRSQARVAFVGPDTGTSGNGRSRIGLEFVDPEPAAQRVLDQYIAERLSHLRPSA